MIKLMNVLLVMAPFVGVWYLYYEPLTHTAGSRQVSVMLLTILMVVYYFFCNRLDGFRVSVRRMGEMIFSQIIAVGVTDVVAAMMIWMLSVWLPNLLPGLICFCVQCAIIVVLVLSLIHI